MPTISKKHLVDRIAEKMQTNRATTRIIVHCFLDEITAELAKDNRLEFRDFGVFEVRERAARMGQNPKTMEKVQVPAKKMVKFKMGRGMREKLSDGTMEQGEVSG